MSQWDCPRIIEDIKAKTVTAQALIAVLRTFPPDAPMCIQWETTLHPVLPDYMFLDEETGMLVIDGEG